MCLIKGAMAPCILRKNDDNWKIISGDCFVLDLHNVALERNEEDHEYLQDVLSEQEALEEFDIW